MACVGRMAAASPVVYVWYTSAASPPIHSSAARTCCACIHVQCPYGSSVAFCGSGLPSTVCHGAPELARLMPVQ